MRNTQSSSWHNQCLSKSSNGNDVNARISNFAANNMLWYYATFSKVSKWRNKSGLHYVSAWSSRKIMVYPLIFILSWKSNTWEILMHKFYTEKKLHTIVLWVAWIKLEVVIISSIVWLYLYNTHHNSFWIRLRSFYNNKLLWLRGLDKYGIVQCRSIPVKFFTLSKELGQ